MGFIPPSSRIPTRRHGYRSAARPDEIDERVWSGLVMSNRSRPRHRRMHSVPHALTDVAMHATKAQSNTQERNEPKWDIVVWCVFLPCMLSRLTTTLSESVPSFAFKAMHG